MTQIAVVLKEMVCRLARREIKASTASTKHAVAQYRRDIARLKRNLQAQQKEITFLTSQEQKRLKESQGAEEPQDGVRFSARSVKAQRRRLKLSAADYGKLVGVSGLTIYNWELGKARPRKAQLAALVAVRGIGKREALAKLELAKAKASRVVARPRKKGKAGAAK